MKSKTELSDALKLASRKGSGAVQRMASFAKNWFKAYVTTGMKQQLHFEDIKKNKNYTTRERLKIGRLYFFAYDAKHKETLPFWDSYPLVIPIQERADTILGLNLHYLPLTERAQLLDALMNLTNNTAMDETTKLKISYDILSTVSKYKFFKPCIKSYLKTNFMTKFVEVPIEHWGTAIFLPVAKWNNASQNDVYRASKQIIRKA